jgi:hypothetical protein
VLHAFKLPFAFDSARLADDASRLLHLVRSPQPGPYHNGEWTGVAIHSAGGVQSAAPGFPSMADYAFTAEADSVPYLKEILASLPFRLQVVRVLWLPPGGVIESHFDFDTNFQFGLVRLHIPLESNPDVEFLIAGQRVDMRVGELWYGDFSQPHQVANRGGQARLHAVLDVELGDEILAQMPPAYVAAQEKLGPISRSRPELSFGDDLSGFECRFFVPGNVLPLLAMAPLPVLVLGASAHLQCCNGRLVLALNDKWHCRLFPVAEEEFAIQGMPPGCFFQIRRRGGTVTSVALIVRGVQESLAAARVGVAIGDRIAERRIDLDLLDS